MAVNDWLKASPCVVANVAPFAGDSVKTGGCVIRISLTLSVHELASLMVTLYTPADSPVAVAAVPPDGAQE